MPLKYIVRNSSDTVVDLVRILPSGKAQSIVSGKLSVYFTKKGAVDLFTEGLTFEIAGMQADSTYWQTAISSHYKRLKTKEVGGPRKRVKLTSDLIDAIKTSLKRGHSPAAVALKHGVGKSRVYAISKRQ